MKAQARSWRLVFLVLLMLGPAAATAGGYFSLRAGLVKGDFGGDVSSKLQSHTATLCYSGVRFDGSVSGQFLDASYDGVDEQGLGDIFLNGGMLVLDEYRSPLDLYAAVSAKIPTADETRGLGSGEPDYGLYLSLARYFGNTKWNVHGGYTVLGDPEGIDYQNQRYLGIGLFRTLGDNGFSTSLEHSSATLDTTGDDAIIEFHAGVFRWLNRKNIVGISGFKGFTDSGADYGAAIEWLHML